MQKLLAVWKTNKLEGSLLFCWLLTVFFSFWGSSILSFSVPLVGKLFPFRIFLPITALLYLIWMLRGNDRIWKDSTLLEKCVYGFIAILVLYGIASLPRALDFMWTFRKLFNLSLDLCFFFLMLRLCRKPEVRKATLSVCFLMLLVLMAMGSYEIFFGGIVNPAYNGDRCQDFTLFLSRFQYPVVFSGNTNDYAILLTFFYALFSLSSLREQHPSRAVHIAVTVFTYFLLLATRSRLCLLAFWLLILAQLCAWLVQGRRAAMRSSAILLLCLCCVWFSNQYRYIVPPIQAYIAQMTEYREQAGTFSPSETPGGPLAPPKPSLQIGDPRQETLDEQFFAVDEETGEKMLREDDSAGVRTLLLLHAWNCFRGSYGLGVGLGNTETLAAQQMIHSNWAGHSQYSIHCFLARLAADCGVFALLPLCVIGLLLLKSVLAALLQSAKRRDKGGVAYGLLFLAVLLIYPIVSTASSDAQDNLEMWMYLAIVVLLAAERHENASDKPDTALIQEKSHA